jgi:hypothetical protein
MKDGQWLIINGLLTINKNSLKARAAPYYYVLPSWIISQNWLIEINLVVPRALTTCMNKQLRLLVITKESKEIIYYK